MPILSGEKWRCSRLSDSGRHLAADAKTALEQLKALGVERTVILTGDNARTAEEIRRECGADQVWAELLPADKVSHLEQIKQSGSTVFVGDGMNDAPVLAMADVGVAMGLGTDAAIEAADVVLVSDKLSDLPQAVKTGKADRIHRQIQYRFCTGY